MGNFFAKLKNELYFYNFIKLLIVNELIIEKHIIFRDHHDYQVEDIHSLIDATKEYKTNKVVTTEKDYVKIMQFEEFFLKNDIQLYVLELEVEVNDEEGFKKEILKRLDD